ncbi:MAG: helix-turn-helix transcriptional regulator [Gemmatimonadetes bacterium]|jgi:DNA-binding HxlR family transcriptional regulator|nr:helix-turn-helix transcriptional regulator [Gemmatimonadota bacterium]
MSKPAAVCPGAAPCSVETETVRDILGSIADKWTLLVLDELDERTLRFTALQRALGGISQKMLTQTLREMERNGFVERTVYPTVPPRVEYTLTPMGRDLGEAICGVWGWTSDNYARVVDARRVFDTKAAAPEAVAR